jgi:hypothetical protein
MPIGQSLFRGPRCSAAHFATHPCWEGDDRRGSLSPQDRHFPDIDLIGTDFFNHMEARFNVDYKEKTCVLEWDEL